MCAALLDFTEIIGKRGFDPKKCRLVRHDHRIMQEYIRGRELYLHSITYQRAGLDPFRGAEIAFQFMPGPRLTNRQHTALFVEAFWICDMWPYGDGSRKAPYHCDQSQNTQSRETRVYDIRPVDGFSDLSERVLILWGSATSTRSWSQWADRNRKEVLELRREVTEPAFPGFAKFATTLEEIAVLPASWRGALASVGGVYLLVCPDTGEQYVGSAYGEGGFCARWESYFADGHGGNALLRPRGRRNYAISILEVASPDMSASDIIAREAHWKEKLGSRAHGLNLN